MGRKAGSMVLTSAGATICLTEVAQHQLTAAVAALAWAVEQLLPTAAFFLPGQPNPQHSQRLLSLCKVLPSTLFMQVLKIESFAKKNYSMMLFNRAKSWVSIYCPSLNECLELTIGLQAYCNSMSVPFSCRQAQTNRRWRQKKRDLLQQEERK